MAAPHHSGAALSHSEQPHAFSSSPSSATPAPTGVTCAASPVFDDTPLPSTEGPAVLSKEDPTAVSGRLTLVRVKRKRSDAPTDSLWLEVGGGAPSKRIHLDGLSLDDGREDVDAADTPPQRSLFRLLETFPEGQDASSPASSSALLAAVALHKTRKTPRLDSHVDRRERERMAQREQELASARNARYLQVRKSRQPGAVHQVGSATSAADAATSELLLYDVVRMEDDAEVAGRKRREQAKREADAREGQLLCNFLPLLREVVPEAGREVEVEGTGGEQSGDEYVYDVYCVEEDVEHEDHPFFDTCPVVQILEDDDYDYREGPDSEADSEDSNDENNDRNDYPDEEDEEGEEEGSGAYWRKEPGGMWEEGSENEIDPYGANEEGEYDTVAYDEEEEETRRQENKDSIDLWQRRK